MVVVVVVADSQPHQFRLELDCTTGQTQIDFELFQDDSVMLVESQIDVVAALVVEISAAAAAVVVVVVVVVAAALGNKRFAVDRRPVAAAADVPEEMSKKNCC